MSTFEQYFGLKRPLFRGDGQAYLYESDQLARLSAIFADAFEEPSALISVRGAIGVGKTTAVQHALSKLPGKTKRINVGRIRLNPDEVIELLLSGLGETTPPESTIRRFGRLSERLSQLQDENTRLVVVVEDAVRTGADTLAELEVLCGADGGFDIGLVICGDETLPAMLDQPKLARLKQRASANVELSPLAADEMDAYLHGAIRHAGGDPSTIVGRDVAGLLHILSCGVPRIAGKLVRSGLRRTAGDNAGKLSCSLLAEVARSEYGLTTEFAIRRERPAAKRPDTAERETVAADKPAMKPVDTVAEVKAAPAAQDKSEATDSEPTEPPKTTVSAAATVDAADDADAKVGKPESTGTAEVPAAGLSATPPPAAEASPSVIPESAAIPATDDELPVLDAEAVQHLHGAATRAASDDDLPVLETTASQETIAATEPETPSPDGNVDDATDDDIPHLIQDTQTELAVLKPELDNTHDHEMLPDLDELSAEIAAVSQRLPALSADEEDGESEAAAIPPDDESADASTDDPVDHDALLEDLEPTLADEDPQPAIAEAVPSPAPQEARSDQAARPPEPVAKAPSPAPETSTCDASAAAAPQRAKPPADERPSSSELSDATEELLAASRALSASLEAHDSPSDGESERELLAADSEPTDVSVASEQAPEPAASNPSLVEEAAGAEEQFATGSFTASSLTLEATGAQSALQDPDDEASIEPANDWDRDPTLAQLKPDLDALELALAEDIVLTEEDPVPEPEPEPSPEPAAMPEITLDASIKQKVEKAVEEKQKGTVLPEKASSSGPSDTEIHRLAEKFSRASSLEEMDDKMAETLFGDEINLVASQVLRQAREKASAPKAPTPPPPKAPAAGPAKPPAASGDDARLRKQFEEVWGEVPGEGETIDLNSVRPNSGLDMSASQRLATVRALNAGMGKTPPPNAKPAPQKPREKPVPIEDQIDISMTATMKALKIDPKAIEQQEEPEPEQKGGFFSRFRKKG